MLLSRRQPPEDAHEREARHARRVRRPLPHPGLVDERLADVEDHRRYSHAATRSRSALVVTFRSLGSPSTQRTRPPAASTSPAQSVASPPPATARRSASARNACGVCTETRSSRSTVSRTRSPSTRLDGVGDGERRDDAVPALRERGEHAADDLVVDERPGGVVDEHRDGLVRDLRQREAHRLGARRAARDDGAHLAGADLLGEQDRRLLPAGRSRDHDRVDPVGLVEPLHARGQERQLARARRTPWAGPHRGARRCLPRRGSPRWTFSRRRTRPSPRRPSPSRPSSCRCPSP